MADREELRVLREAAAHLRAWRKIGLSLDSGAFETWEAEMREALRKTVGESHTISVQILSLIDGVKRRTKLGMSDEAALDALAPEIDQLAADALGIAEENPPRVRTLGDMATIVEAQRIYDPSLPTLRSSGARSESAGRGLSDPRKIFVVHGRNESLRGDFFDFLRAIDLSPMEWSQALALTGKASPFVGEVLEAAFANARAVVVLLTPDDEVRLAPKLWSDTETVEEKEYRGQARPNVLFEAGMAFGRDPGRTLLVEIGPVKVFSDIWGRHVVRLNNSAERRKEIANRLRTAGCAVSESGTEWLSKGDFEVAPLTLPAADPMADPRTFPVAEKTVDLNYPRDSGLQAKLESAGYEVRWCMEDQLGRRVDIEGWSRATIKEGEKVVSLKAKDRPFDQVLIAKRKA